jgi:S1-C subfamily serine protease
MTRSARSHFLSAVVGGLVVGAGLLVFGAAGRGRTETIIDEAPVASQPAAGTSGGPSGLTPHDIYQRDAPGVVYVQAKLVAPTESPFNMFHAWESNTSTGSGFLVDRRGDVLTDYHVVDNAGGPLLDAGGQVIGINSEVIAPETGDRGGQALAFAVPIDTASEILARAAHAGPVRVAYIGLGGGSARGSRTGVSIASVVRGGPAAAGGVRQGDVIERVDGDPVASISDVLALVTTRSPGQSLTLTLRRRHRLRTLTVVLGSRTAPSSSDAQ